jgi:tetratricopeptide (TPR) repeat protein
VFDLSKPASPMLSAERAPLFEPPNSEYVTNGVLRWRVGTWEPGPPHRFKGDPGTALAFCGDGRYVLRSRDDGMQTLGLVKQGRPAARLEVPEPGRAWFAAFTPDAARVVYANIDQIGVHVWDLRELRKRLNEMGLDWEAPEYPPAAAPGPPLTVTLKGVDLVFDRKAYDVHDRAAALDAVKKNDKDADAQYRLGLHELNGGDAVAAVRRFDVALKVRPDHESSLLWRGRALVRLNRGAEALADADRLMKLNGAAVQARVLRAEALIGLNHHDDVVAFLDSHDKLTWREAELRAEAQQKRDRPDAAKADRRRAAEALAALPDRRLDDAWDLADGPLEMRDLDAAERLTREALRRWPGSLADVRVLGLIQYRKAEFGRAAGTLTRSRVERPFSEQGIELYLLAACLARMGDRGQAQTRVAEGDRAVKQASELTPGRRGVLRSFRAEAEEAIGAAR